MQKCRIWNANIVAREDCRLSILLTALLWAALLALLLLRSIVPAAVLPEMNVPNIALLSLAALVIDHYAARGRKAAREGRFVAALAAALGFFLLPLEAEMTDLGEAIKLGMLGGITFGGVALMFDSAQMRPNADATGVTPIVNALCIYLAAQGFSGMGI